MKSQINSKSGFQMAVKKTKPKQLLRPITTGANSVMKQSQFLEITCNLLKAQEKSLGWCNWFWFCFSLAE